ncbi:MAG: hypothetical protein HYU63_07210 [Armatimonadetes bacterium]|nr:hypothetical protein [Armatimonadota bacterium]
MTLEFLKRNLNLKILSICLAIFLWIYVKQTQNILSGVTSHAIFWINLETINKPPETIASNLPEKISVTVKGAPKIIENLKNSDFKAYIDLLNKLPGTYPLKINVAPPPGVEIIDKYPNQILIKLERIIKKKFAVLLKLQGKLKQGFGQGDIQIMPADIWISAPETLINGIKEVQVILQTNQIGTNLAQKIEPAAISNNNQIIFDKLNFNPKYVQVRLLPRGRTNIYHLPIHPNISADLKSGFIIKSININPSAATVSIFRGKSPEFLTTEPIKVNSAHKNFIIKANILPQSGISILSEKAVKINILIEKKY